MVDEVSDAKDDEEREVVLTPRSSGWVEVAGLSCEEEDELYMALETIYLGSEVDGVNEKPYLIRVSGVSSFVLSNSIEHYYVRQGIPVRGEKHHS